VAAETKRIRTEKKSRAEAATSIVGRKPPPKKRTRHLNAYGNTSGTDHNSEQETFLDEPLPDYVEQRKKKLKGLHEAGLRYPPSYDDIELSESVHEERPILHPDIKSQREKKAIRLRETGGIIPAPIAQWLRDYQITGAQWLHEKFVHQTGAILGDDMGLGKTIQVIAFLTAAFGKTGTNRDDKLRRKVRALDDRWYPKILIICPGGLMANWEDELEKWGWWEVSKYHGPPADKKGVLAAARKGALEIMITTYATYRINEGDINLIDWDCVIADECHQVKNKSAAVTKAMGRVNALCRIGLTGTAIQNKYEELWNLLNWARPGAYGSFQQWKQSISIPLRLGQAHDANNAQLAKARATAIELRDDLLPGVFLRRMKSIIADQLPKKSDRVVFCELAETQAEAYRAYVESPRCEYIRRSKEPCDCGSGKTRGWCCYQEVPGEGKWSHAMFPAMMSLKKIADHLALLLPQSNESPEKQDKALESLRLACPDNWNDLYRNRENLYVSAPREFCGKWKVLRRLLDFWQSNGDKALIFSHSVRLLRCLKHLFDIEGTKYNFSYLDGSMSYEDRFKTVKDFNSNPNQFVFLISTLAGGVGLNITSANKVVVVDPNWNPAYDLQAQDRAYRIGQTRDVEVFRLVSSGTIEEIVYARQIYKQQQANIGYTASEERRYFKGVMDNTEKAGEIFGARNLFSYEENGLLLRGILQKTDIAETKAKVKIMDYECNVEDSDFESDDEDDALSNKALGITTDADEDAKQASQVKKFIQKYSASGSGKAPKRKEPNPINAILAKAGVQYTHENSEVIGRSRVEADLSRQAMEIRNDVELGRKQVFQSQSQSQSQHRGVRFGYGDGQDSEQVDGDDDGEDVRIVGGSAKKGEFKINYRYRPDEGVRRRQFCEMSRLVGFEDPVEFALMVEDMTGEERRKTLGRFYRARRKAVMEDTGAG
jgi:SNF2 family DNA or RNA helicase